MRKIRRLVIDLTAALVLLFFMLPLVAQTDTVNKLPNLLLPQFTKSVIKLKSGQVNTAILNYNIVDQVMVFRQNKLFMVLNEPELIDTVFMANRIFVPFDKGFYELVINGPTVLFIQHKAYVEFEGYPTLYGAKSQTTAPSYVRQIYGARGPIDLAIPAGYTVVPDPKYRIQRNNQMIDFDSKRQFLKIFPDKENELNKFISKNRIDFKKADDVIRLVNFCNELNR